MCYELEQWEMVDWVEANDVTENVLFLYDKNRRIELICSINQFDVSCYLGIIKEFNSYEIVQKQVSQSYFSQFARLVIRRYSMVSASTITAFK